MNPIYLNQMLSSKLHQNNFNSWKMEVSVITSLLGLTGYLDGTNLAPPVTVLSAEGVAERNPNYISWCLQDQLLLGWLRAMILPPVLAEVITISSTSAELWGSLHSYVEARIAALQQRLLNTHRGSRSCSVFFGEMEAVANELASLGAPISEAELVSAIASNLGPVFEPFHLHNQSRPNGPLPLGEFRDMLLVLEQVVDSAVQNMQGQVAAQPPHLAPPAEQPQLAPPPANPPQPAPPIPAQPPQNE